MFDRLKDWMGAGPDYPGPVQAISNLGWRHYAGFLRQQYRMSRTSEPWLVTLRSKHAAFPVVCRSQTTDIKVFSQIFMFREYRCLDRLREPALVIDCGANAGYSSAYFLSRFPTAELIAVEPDPGNFAILEQNLQPFGTRARAVHSAVWSHPARLTLNESPFRDGREWSRQVRECGPEEAGGFLATDIGTLLRESGRERISLLKIDVEGAEGVIFAKNQAPWLDRVDALVIELHDDTAFGDNRAIFAAATKNAGFEFTECGELTVGLRPAGAQPARQPTPGGQP
jgi:FkbM family methyltransferase